MLVNIPSKMDKKNVLVLTEEEEEEEDLISKTKAYIAFCKFYKSFSEC